MRPTRTPTLREMNPNAPRRFWDDPDLAPPPRREVPLTAFA